MINWIEPSVQGSSIGSSILRICGFPCRYVMLLVAAVDVAENGAFKSDCEFVLLPT